MSIAENVAAIRSRIHQAALEAGRDPDQIQLCAATKMNDAVSSKAADNCNDAGYRKRPSGKRQLQSNQTGWATPDCREHSNNSVPPLHCV